MSENSNKNKNENSCSFLKHINIKLLLKKEKYTNTCKSHCNGGHN